MPRETSFVSRPAQDVREKRVTCATREDEASDSSRFSRQSHKSRTKNEIRFPLRSFDGSTSRRFDKLTVPSRVEGQAQGPVLSRRAS